MIIYFEQRSEQTKHAYITYSVIIIRAQTHWVNHDEEWKSKSRTHMIHAEMRAMLFAFTYDHATIPRSTLLFLFRFQSTNKNQTKIDKSGNTTQKEKTKKKHGSYNSSVSFTLNVKLNGSSVFLLLFCPLHAYIHFTHSACML